MTDRPAFRPPQPLWVDAALALAVIAAQIVGAEILVRTAGAERPMDLLAYALLGVSGGVLVVRDRAPMTVLLTVVGIVLAYTWLGYAGGTYTVSLVIAIWAAVSAGRRAVALVVCIGLIGLILLASYVVPIGHAADADAPIWLIGWLVASFVLGEVSRSRRRYLEAVEQRAIDAERTREEEARRRAEQERLRIARELHDVLAHNISTINVQSGVATHLMDRQPQQAREALVAISHASKEALRELRATLGLLRGVDEDDPRAPVPGLARLGDLVDTHRAAGLDVEVATTGRSRPLSPTVDLAAYRIVQESLTNVSRHADARRATVSLDYKRRDLVVTIDDDGNGVPDPGAPPPAGNGLTGMRERAAAAGGEVSAGARPDGAPGFRVRARLPTEGRA